MLFKVKMTLLHGRLGSKCSPRVTSLQIDVKVKKTGSKCTLCTLQYNTTVNNCLISFFNDTVKTIILWNRKTTFRLINSMKMSHGNFTAV